MPHSPDALDPAGTVHVGRQPVYDRARQPVGYELLFRRDAQALEATERGANATSQVIITAITEIGLNTLVGDHLCFLNLTREFLVGQLPLPFGPERMVLEVLETIEIDDEVVRGVKDLVARGYVIALDDFVFQPGYRHLLELASYVKIDVLDVAPAEVLAMVAVCREYPDIKLVAERLETDEQVRFATDAGFDYFQGYALARPQVVSVPALGPPRLSGIGLLGLLVDANLPQSKLTSLVTSDAALSVRMLAAANADPLGLPVPISSVDDAVSLLGGPRLRDWTTLMLASDLDLEPGPRQDDHRSQTAISRARRCQRLAACMNVSEESAFAIGLVSAVAESLNQHPAELAPRLSLNRELTDALVDGTGPLGDLLSLVLGFEATDPPTGPVPPALGPDPAQAAFEAMAHADRLDGETGDHPF